MLRTNNVPPAGPSWSECDPHASKMPECFAVISLSGTIMSIVTAGLPWLPLNLYIMAVPRR